MFHLMGALSRYGKLGMVAVAEDLASADHLPGHPLGARQARTHYEPTATHRRRNDEREVATRVGGCLVATESGRPC